ncbi:MAG: hypothetical protein LBI63_01835 [Candidatus Ancillula sp.]|jgi:hypothetical protein|nr:hypothetical protein [Candidatus Ancillula sp.]
MSVVNPEVERKILDAYNKQLDELVDKAVYNHSLLLEEYDLKDIGLDELNLYTHQLSVNVSQKASTLANKFYSARRVLYEKTLDFDLGTYDQQLINSDYSVYKEFGGGNNIDDGYFLGTRIMDIKATEKGQLLLERLWSKKVDALNPNLLKNQMYSTARNTLELLSEKDRACEKFARVPRGAKTCAFCIMLASRGFVYKNKSRAGDVQKFHSVCDCTVVSSWTRKDDPLIKGYKLDAYKIMYENARNSVENAVKSKRGNDIISLSDIAKQMRAVYPSNATDSGYSSTNKVSSILLSKVGEGIKTPTNGVVEQDYRYLDGKKYEVDGKHVVSKPTDEELSTAKWISEKFGKEVDVLPVINEPQGIKNPDLYFDGRFWDIKNVSTANSVNNQLKKASEQTHGNGAILELSDNLNMPLDEYTSVISQKMVRQGMKTIIIKKGDDLIDILQNSTKGLE